MNEIFRAGADNKSRRVTDNTKEREGVVGMKGKTEKG